MISREASHESVTILTPLVSALFFNVSYRWRNSESKNGRREKNGYNLELFALVFAAALSTLQIVYDGISFSTLWQISTRDKEQITTK